MQILLAEDDRSHSELIETLIRTADADCRVATVQTGAEFIDRLRHTTYDVALLDYYLPDADASQLLPQIDLIPNRPPVVVISSDRASDTIISALRSGGRDFLPKEEAFSSDQLLVRIRAAIQRQQSERAMIEQQKEACISALAGGIAHDFNNMLVGILGKAALLRDNENKDPRHSEYCNGIIRTAERMADLSRQLLAYSRGGKYNPKPVDPHVAVRDTLSMLSGTVPATVEVQSLLSSEIWQVEADSSQLVQALLNLCLNASEAMGGRGKLTVFTENETRAESWVDDLGVQHSAGDFVRLVVADTGCGIPKQIRDDIFRPYFSTKGTGRGLGLAAVRGIVTEHGGGLVLQTEQGVGTSIHLLFPRYQGAPVAKQPTNPAAPQHTGHILIIDDESDVRETIAEILERRGFTTAYAENGESALSDLRSAPGSFDLVILDMRLPDCSGADVLRVIREQDPALPVVLCSGYERVSVLQEVLAGEEQVPFLTKPFLPNDLIGVVNVALHARQAS